MAHRPVRRARSRWLAGLALLFLALIVCLTQFVGQGGCTSAIAFDRPPSSATTERTPVDVADPGPGAGSGAGSAPSAAARGSAPSQRIAGVVVDRATAEPVPEVEVELRGGSLSERVLTASDGTFVTAGAFPGGRVTATVADDGVPVAEFQREHSALVGKQVWRLEVPIGPTVPIARIDGLAPDVALWRARIRESALAEGIAGELDVHAAGLSLRAPSAELPDREWSWVRVRAGAAPWIRYPRREHDPVVGLHALLEVRCDEKPALGRHPLRSTIGIQRPVEVATAVFSTLRGRIEAAGGRLMTPTRIVLCDRRAALIVGRDAPQFDEVTVERDGSFRFDFVQPGNRSLLVYSPDAFELDGAQLRSGEIREQTIRVSHRSAPNVPIQAFTGNKARRQAKTVGWSGASERILLGFEPAPVRLRGFVTSIDRMDGLREGLRLPAHGIALERTIAVSLDTPGRGPGIQLVAYEFRAAGNTGAEVAFGPEGGIFLLDERRTPLRFQAPDGLEFSWSVWAPGCQPVFGSQADLLDRDGEVRFNSVNPARGWGAQILLRAGDPEAIQKDPWPWLEPVDETNRGELAAIAAPPLPGVALEIDGMPAGRSDEHGEIRIGHPILPLRLTLACTGWRLCALDRLSGPGLRYVAWLKRAP